jgi:hypothetical protein
MIDERMRGNHICPKHLSICTHCSTRTPSPRVRQPTPAALLLFPLGRTSKTAPLVPQDASVRQGNGTRRGERLKCKPRWRQAASFAVPGSCAGPPPPLTARLHLRCWHYASTSRHLLQEPGPAPPSLLAGVTEASCPAGRPAPCAGSCMPAPWAPAPPRRRTAWAASAGQGAGQARRDLMCCHQNSKLAKPLAEPLQQGRLRGSAFC